MALFGRDSLITSYQALPYRPELARDDPDARWPRARARRCDDFRDEEPGKILHELRFGELTAIGERPHSPYYGTADATPLFLVLLDEYERWTGDAELVRDARAERARRAGVDRPLRRPRRRRLRRVRRPATRETGLVNQCWKDSWNSIAVRRRARSPRARSPPARSRATSTTPSAACARLAREVWDDAGARRPPRRGGRRAAASASIEDFWIPERECFALALDGDKRQVDSLTSNIGHLLWSGIVDDERADAVAAHLMDAPLFSGWGVRTMAGAEGGYNPIEYHNGTVWPHDNSLIAAGLRRYGHRDAAAGSPPRAAGGRLLRAPPARGVRRLRPSS